jgi:hypothetical protein
MLGPDGEQAGSQLAHKHPNGIPDTSAADKEHKYESATYTDGWIVFRSCGPGSV